jgi:hypothetical protein
MGTLPKLAAVSAMALFVASSGSAFAANPSLPNLPNLKFLDYTGLAPKTTFNLNNPTGWSGGGGLIFIAKPCTGGCVPGSANDQSAAGPGYLQTYGNPLGFAGGGNYVEADGNPTFESSFNFTVTGLTAGQEYDLSFYQGASTQFGFGFNDWTQTNTGTTNQWIVSLADSPLQTEDNGRVDPMFGPALDYFSTDPNASIATSDLMTVPFQGTVGWMFTKVTLKANTDTELLSFLAWGDNGSTVNLPPMAFLTGVDAPPGLVPEPSTWAMMGLGFVGLAGMAWRRGKRPARTIEV